MIANLKEIFHYREMLKNMVRKDLRTRYKGSVLGFLWTFINPLMQLIVYTVIFSTIMDVNIEKFYMYLFVALLPWIFFSTSLLSSASTIIANKDLVKKIYFPRAVLPLSVVASNFMNLLFGFAIVFPALIISGVGIHSSIVYLPLALLAIFIMALAFALIMAALNVFFRDLEHILGIIVMAWFYFTPIVYPLDRISEPYLKYFKLNPLLPIINSFRDILYYGKAPDIWSLGINMLIGIIFLIIGFLVFQSLQRNFAEEI